MINIVKTIDGAYQVYEDGVFSFVFSNAIWRSYGSDNIQIYYITKIVLIDTPYSNLQVGGVNASSVEDAGNKLAAIGLGFNTASGGSGATDIKVVSTYNDLPDPTTVSEQFYFTENSQGTAWLPGSLGGNYYRAGLYYSNGVDWVYSPHPYEATQAQANAGTNNDTFITPLTLNDYFRWNNKANLNSSTSRLQTNEAPLTWSFLAEHWTIEPSLNATIALGDIYQYDYLGVVRYRLVTNPYDSALDSFYGNFDGTNLTGLITTRG